MIGGRWISLSRHEKFEISTSRSPLESWDLFSKFLFLFSKLEKIADFSIIFCKNSRSLLEPENRSRHFSFLFSKFEIWIPYFSFSSRFHFLASCQCLVKLWTKRESSKSQWLIIWEDQCMRMWEQNTASTVQSQSPTTLNLFSSFYCFQEKLF